MDLEGITQETLEAVKKAQTTGLTSGTGILGVNLAGLISLIPVDTPWRNMLAREGASEGAKFATWRALLNVNNQQPNPATAYDAAAGLVLIDEQDVQAKFQPIGMGYTVTQDAVDLAKGYADAKAVTALNTLNQLMIGEDKLLIGAQSFALTTPGTPTVTPLTTGGSIAASTAVPLKVAARTGANYFYGGSTVASAGGTATTGSGTATNSATGFVASVPGAVAYDWFVNGFYYTTTTTNTVTITSIPTAAQPLPLSTYPDLSSIAPTVPPTADSSAGANQFDGLLASLTGSYTAAGVLETNGVGTPSGATVLSADGAQLSLAGGSISQFDQLFLSIYQSVRLSPDALMMNGQHMQDIASIILAQPSAVTFLQPDSSGRLATTGSGHVANVVNKITGTTVKLELHPQLPQGTIVARTDTVPFPGSNLGKTCRVETLRDYADYTYGSGRGTVGVAGGGPREDGEIRCIESFQNKAPVAMAVLQNVLGSSGH
jgi:hypothetical protein